MEWSGLQSSLVNSPQIYDFEVESTGVHMETSGVHMDCRRDSKVLCQGVLYEVICLKVIHISNCASKLEVLIQHDFVVIRGI